MTEIWSEELAKDQYQKNTSPTMRLEFVIYRLQVHAFYQLSYLGPLPTTNLSRPPAYHQSILRDDGAF